MSTIFITGASSGLGKATAKLLASKGWNVIATMRHPEKETELNVIKCNQKYPSFTVRCDRSFIY
jgi:NAD(P)-dependent dehydrogenase (short-subunit alcohol dehydrogenase family)